MEYMRMGHRAIFRRTYSRRVVFPWGVYTVSIAERLVIYSDFKRKLLYAFDSKRSDRKRDWNFEQVSTRNGDHNRRTVKREWVWEKEREREGGRAREKQDRQKHYLILTQMFVFYFKTNVVQGRLRSRAARVSVLSASVKFLKPARHKRHIVSLYR